MDLGLSRRMRRSRGEGWRGGVERRMGTGAGGASEGSRVDGKEREGKRGREGVLVREREREGGKVR